MNLDVLEAELAAARALREGDWIAARQALRQMLGEHPEEELVRDVTEWASEQVERAKSAPSRRQVAEAELCALRSLMRPHFMFSALSSINTLVRTDPGYAHELMLELAEFARYSLRWQDDFTTLADELSEIHRYLMLEQARIGRRVNVRLKIAPETLRARIPFLCLQPLVQNAVQHGISARPGPGHLLITAEDNGTEWYMTVDDDGIGADADQLLCRIAGEGGDAGISLSNINERLRRLYGDEYRLVIETAVGAGMKVILRIPKRSTRSA
jgi:two-component system, LytTR family, sensor kinase